MSYDIVRHHGTWKHDIACCIDGMTDLIYQSYMHADLLDTVSAQDQLMIGEMTVSQAFIT